MPEDHAVGVVVPLIQAGGKSLEHTRDEKGLVIASRTVDTPVQIYEDETRQKLVDVVPIEDE